MSKLRKSKSIFLLVVSLCLLFSSTSSKLAAQRGSQFPENDNNGGTHCSSMSPSSIIYVEDSDWSDSSSTSDCAQGWGNDEWHLTLSQPKTVRIQVDDCCCPGDYYSVYVNGNLLGTTPKPAVWGCDYSGDLSSGSFEIWLPVGTHIIKVRDASFTEHTLAEIADQRMCPAGFTIYGTLLTPPSAPDVALDADSWGFENNTSPYLPEKFWVSVTANNIGTTVADNVVVRFYLGNPDQGGVQIGSDQALGSIAVNGQAEATVEWALSGNVEDEALYARAFVASDLNEENNTISQSVGVWYIPFEHGEDAYSFKNWGLEWEDVKNDLLMFLDLHHPDDIPTAILFPVIYPVWAMLTESGGHCYGMSATSSLYYQYPEIKPVQKDTYDMTKEEVRSDIQYYQRHQFTHMMELIMQDIAGFNGVNQYNRALSSIRDDGEPIMLLMGTEEGNHAVVGYKLLDLGSEKRLYMYDNNRPLSSMNSSLYGTVDSDSGTFLYDSPYGYDFDQFLAREPLMSWPDSAEVILERFYNWVLEQILDGSLIRVSVGTSTSGLQASHAPFQSGLAADPLITDQYNRRVGYLEGSLINEIPGATVTPLESEVVLDLPDDLQYTVTTTGNGTGEVGLTFLIPESADVVREVGYFEIPVANDSVASAKLGRGNTDWTLTNTEEPSREPDSLVDHRFYRNYLPVVATGTSCGGQMIVNPSFEQGSSVGWSSTSSTDRKLITNDLPLSVYPYNGNWAAWLGYNTNETSNLAQTINTSQETTAATLTYWYWIDSDESGCSYDLAWLELNGGMLRLYNLCGDGNTYGWVQDTVDLTPYLGQPMTIKFHVDTDYSVTSNFFVDDVTLDVQCAD